MSLYKYNDVVVQHCRTLSFEWVMERDPTGTDALWNRYTIRVRGFVVASQGQFPVVGSAGTDSAATLNGLKARLEAPRKSLIYAIGASTLVSVTGAMDAKLGPDPLPAVVREVSSGVFMVECGCVARIVNCDNVCDERNPVVSLRWSQTESFDENWYSHLTTAGRLIVRTDLLRSADSFRPLTTPPLLNDYRRTTARYVLSPDGTTLDFHFEDQEVDRLPPNPATTCTGTFTVFCPRPGTERYGTVDLALEGPKGSSRRQLMLLGLNMAYAKLESEILATRPPVVWGRFSEDLFRPRVTVQMEAMLAPLQGGKFGSARPGLFGRIFGGTPAPVTTSPNIMNTVGFVPFGVASPGFGLAPPVRKRLAGLLAAAFSDPCACLAAEAELRTDPGTAGSGNTAFILGASGAIANAVASISVGTLSPTPPTVSVVRDLAPYDSYTLEASYRYDSGTVHMPATGTGPNADVSALVKVHGSRMCLDVVWVAGRTGAPPVLPTFASGDPNVVPLKAAIVEKNIEMSADTAQVTHLVSGYYTYAVLDPKRVNMAAPIPPFLSQSVWNEAARSAQFSDQNILWAFRGSSGANPALGTGLQNGATPLDVIGGATESVIGGVLGGVNPDGLQRGGGTGGGNFTGPPIGA